MKKIAVLTSSFAVEDASPLSALRSAGYEAVLNPHGRKLTVPETLQLASGAEGIIAGLEEWSEKVIQGLPELRAISRCGTGMDNVDLEAAKKRGISVFNTPDAVTPAVAELTLGLILALLRNIPQGDGQVKRGVWQKKMGNLLAEKKLGVIGFGRIGRRVAELALAFGAETAFYDIASPAATQRTKALALSPLLAWADIVTVHCSGSADTSALLGAQELRSMKKGSWLVNTSRGNLVDEAALTSLLQEGHLAGAALDVFGREPYDGPLTKLENTILTPHIGSYAKECRARMEAEAAENLVRALRGSGAR